MFDLWVGVRRRIDRGRRPRTQTESPGQKDPIFLDVSDSGPGHPVGKRVKQERKMDRQNPV